MQRRNFDQLRSGEARRESAPHVLKSARYGHHGSMEAAVARFAAAILKHSHILRGQSAVTF